MSVEISERPARQLWPSSFITQTRGLPTIGGLAAWALSAIAAFSGQSLATSAHPEDARPWLIASAVLGLAGVVLLERRAPDVEPVPCQDDGKVWRSTARRRNGGIGLLAFGGVASGVATLLLVLRVPPATVTSVWAIGLLAACLGAALISRPLQVRWRPTGATILEAALFVGLLGVAIWLRVPNLATIPPNVHGDEADVGLLAREILAGRMPAIFATSPAAEATALTFALHAATMRVFGDNLFGLRMAASIEGLISIVFLYLLTRRLWGPRPALVAASLMAVAAWHIHFSRTGFHYMQAQAAMLFTLYFMVRGIHDRRALDWLLCGFGIGLCIEVYYAARLAPVVLALYIGYRSLTERGFLHAHAHGLVALAFGAFIFLAPMGAIYGSKEGSFIQRAAAVLVTSPSNLQHEFDAYHVNTVPEVLAIQSLHTLEAFNIRGETSLEYGHPGPLFDFWTCALLAMGAIAILLRPTSPRGVLLASWVWLALILGSVLTTDAMFSPHIVVAIPALVLAPALMLERVWQSLGSLFGRAATYAFAVPVVVLLSFALQANVHDYFDVYTVERQPSSRFTLLSTYAASIGDRYRMYVIGRPDFTLQYVTPRFLVPNPDAVDVRNASLTLPLERIPSTKGAAFLVESSADDSARRLDLIRQTYPHGREEVISERAGNVFTSYLVDNADLVAANPSAIRD